MPFIGEMYITDGKGNSAAADAYIDFSTGTLYVRADTLSTSVSENTEHEINHWLSIQNEWLVDDFMEAVKKNKEAAWRPVYETYKRRYSAIADFDAMSEKEAERYVFDEILGDAKARIDRFGVRASAFNAAAEAAYAGEVTGSETREGVNAMTGETAAATERTNGPGKLSIASTVLEDFKKVRKGVFPKKTSEVYIGTSSNFLTKTIGTETLPVTMPAFKVYAAVVSEADAMRANAPFKYDPKAHYHDLGEEKLLKVLEAAENPIAAYVDTATEGNKRQDRIVLVTDEKTADGQYYQVVQQVEDTALLNARIIKANKDITVYDRRAVASDLVSAGKDRVLFLDKKRSQAILTGVPGANSLTSMREADFNNNIQDFWNGVKWKKSGITEYTAESKIGPTETGFQRAFREANEERVYVANKNDRVQKDGARNNHKVIDKLARYNGDNLRALATIHLSELLETSGDETRTEEHTHKWLDQNGWIHRYVYVQDRNGMIYKALLNISDGRDRKIIYDINNIRLIDKAKSTTGGAVPSAVSGGARSTSRSAFLQNSTYEEKSQERKENPAPRFV